MSKKKNTKNSTGAVEGRIDALIALVAGILRVMAGKQKLKEVRRAENEAIIALFSTGMKREKIRNLLGVDNNWVIKICKKLKNK